MYFSFGVTHPPISKSSHGKVHFFELTVVCGTKETNFSLADTMLNTAHAYSDATARSCMTRLHLNLPDRRDLVKNRRVRFLKFVLHYLYGVHC